MKSARLPMLGLATLLLASPMSALSDEAKKTAKEPSFGVIQAPSLAQVRGQALDWLKSVKGDEQKFQTIWSDEDRTLLDKVADTFALGSPEAARLLAEARSP